MLSRIMLLSLVAVAFAGLTQIYGDSLRAPEPNPRWQEIRWRRPAAPRFSLFPQFVGQCLLVGFFTLIGRVGLRLRLSPAPQNDEKPVALNLR